MSQDYAQLKKFFTASVNPKGTTACQGSGVVNPANPINSNDMGWCYSNYNFAIMRVLLPKVAGYSEDVNQLSRPLTLANQYFGGLVWSGGRPPHAGCAVPQLQHHGRWRCEGCA